MAKTAKWFLAVFLGSLVWTSFYLAQPSDQVELASLEKDQGVELSLEELSDRELQQHTGQGIKLWDEWNKAQVPEFPVSVERNQVGLDVQGYVDGSASYQAGCIDQSSFEAGVKTVCVVDMASEMTNFTCTAHVADAECGVDVNQSKFESSFTKTDTCGFYSQTVNGKFAVGSADMSSLGGVAMFASNIDNLNAFAQVTNNHTIHNSATYSCGPCTTGAAYSGSQTLNLQANFNQ